MFFRPVRRNTGTRHHLAAVGQQDVVDPHFGVAIPGRVTGHGNPVPFAQETGVHVHAAQDAYGVGLDVPGLALRGPYGEPHMRIAPHEPGDLALKLGEVVHVENAAEGVMANAGNRQQTEQSDRKSGVAAKLAFHFSFSGIQPQCQVTSMAKK